MRAVRPVLIGLGTTFVFVMMLQAFGGIFWPAPPGFNLNDDAALMAARSAAPLLAKLYAVLTFGVAVFVGAFLACKIAGGINTRPSWIVGIVYTAVCALYAFGSRSPLWMQLSTVAMPLPAAWLALKAASVRQTAVPDNTKKR